MTNLRRFLLIFALMFWQGGFMFYGAVVVPIVRESLPGPERSIITQKVTQWMNLAGTAALLVMFVDVWAGGSSGRRWRWIAWAAMVAPLPVLVWLHGEMSRQMHDPLFYQTDVRPFLLWHRAYLLCNTFQWLAGMVFTMLTVRAWRADDRDSKGSERLGMESEPERPQH
jgi:hypothetical protein